MTIYLIIGAILACFVVYKITRIVGTVKSQLAAGRDQYLDRRTSEENTLESADWIGRTGLDEATERELPRYLRREFGEFMDDPDGLKASDLQYIGIFTDERGEAHFWRVPSKTSQDPYFAYVEIDQQGKPTFMGWGDRTLPLPESAA